MSAVAFAEPLDRVRERLQERLEDNAETYQRMPLHEFADRLGWTLEQTKYRVREGVIVVGRHGARGHRFVWLDFVRAQRPELWRAFQWRSRLLDSVRARRRTEEPEAREPPPAELSIGAYAKAANTSCDKVRRAIRHAKLPSRRIGSLSGGRSWVVIPVDELADSYACSRRVSTEAGEEGEPAEDGTPLPWELVASAYGYPLARDDS